MSKHLVRRPDGTLIELPATLPEAHQVILSLLDVIDGLRVEVASLKARVAELEERLNQNSGNSSKPPSQDSPGQRDKRPGKPPTGTKKGAQPGHRKQSRMMIDEAAVDALTHYYPEGQCACGGAIALEAEPHLRHQVFDLPEVKYTVTEHQVHAGRCTRCGKHCRGGLPDDVPSGQMGPGLIAWIGLLNGGNRLSTRTLQSLLAEQWGLHFSLGAISECQQKLADWLKAPHAHIGDMAKAAPVAHADETTHYRYSATQGLERHWLWTLTAGPAVYFSAHFSRGKRAAGNLLEGFDGVLVTDRLGSYRCHPQERRQVCLAHVIRNLTAMSQRKGEPGRLGKAAGALAAAGIPDRACVGARVDTMTTDVTDIGWIDSRTSFIRGIEQGAGWTSCKKTMNQCRQLLRDEPMLWTFRRYPDVPLTNNAAERAVRPYVIWRKTSFFSQSARGDRFRERILSVIGELQAAGGDGLCSSCGWYANRALKISR
jgi:transposase